MMLVLDLISPDRSTERNLIFRSDHRVIKASSSKKSPEGCIGLEGYDKENDLFRVEDMDVVETRVATNDEVNEARKDIILGYLQPLGTRQRETESK